MYMCASAPELISLHKEICHLIFLKAFPQQKRTELLFTVTRKPVQVKENATYRSSPGSAYSQLHRLRWPVRSHQPCSSMGEYRSNLLSCVQLYSAGFLFSEKTIIRLRIEMFTACIVLLQILKSATSIYFLDHSDNCLKKLETFRLLFSARPAVKLVLLPMHCLYSYSQFNGAGVKSLSKNGRSKKHFFMNPSI